MIFVCGLADMPHHVRALRVGYLVSLVQAEFQPPTPPGLAPERHLRVAVDDIDAEVDGYVMPAEAHVSQLIGFLERWPADAPLLLHCFAGVSRSTAAALIALALEREHDELESARLLRRAAPHAQPNPRIIALADALMGRDGRLVAARQAMGPARPLMEGPLVELPTLRGR